jgi:O-antigen ligase
MNVVLLGAWVVSSRKAARLAIIWSTIGATLAVVVGLTFPVNSARFVTGLHATLARFSEAGDDNGERALGQLSELFYAIGQHPLGNGPGTEQVGGNALATGVMQFTTYESQFPRIVAEMGLVGFCGFLLLVFATLALISSWKRLLPYNGYFETLTATQVLLLTLFYTNIVFNHTAATFVWTIVAAVLAGASSRFHESDADPDFATAANQPSINT